MKKSFEIKIMLMLSIYFIFLNTSCKKQNDFLAVVPNNHLAIPRTLNDLQLLLQESDVFNYRDPSLGIASADEIFVTPALYAKQTPFLQGVYTWGKSLDNNLNNGGVWADAYAQVYNANVVLDALPGIKITPNQQALYNSIKGTALFFRAKAFFNLMQLFSLPYNPNTAVTNLGIPLRLTSDFNAKVGRATERQCYDQIISDFQLATQLLPATTKYYTQPSATSASGFLARTYLEMADYNNAYKYSNAFLSQFSTLTDYNQYVSAGSLTNVPSEVQFFSADETVNIELSFSCLIDSNLYASFEQNDIRKQIWFLNTTHGGVHWVGTYDTNNYNDFTGIASDEMYLTRAECYARQGNTAAALTDLNALIKTRFITGTFVPYTATSADDALDKILLEREKELLYRCLRWSDLRRLNQEPRFAKTLERNIGGTIYTLPPNDPRYALPIPDVEIQLTGIPQNSR